MAQIPIDFIAMLIVIPISNFPDFEQIMCHLRARQKPLLFSHL
jgi:hypothetical protein